ncbi:polysaccharide polymerase, partial [Pediococcus acidilactici]|uniref:polysaccharide polymerase n=3 Tax=Pediococcus acidilactici TaxID=1254 RepID=UPI001C601039
MNQRINLLRASSCLTKTVFFSIGYIMWLSSYLITRLQQFSNVSDIVIKPLKFGGLIIAFFIILMDLKIKLEVRRFLLGVLTLAFIALNNGYVAGVTIWIGVAIFIFAAKNINFRLFLKIVLVFLCVFYGSSVLLAKFGFILNSVSYRDVFVRDNLGFVWATWPVHAFLYIVAFYAILRGKKINIAEILVLGMINLGLYYYTNTRSPFILITIFLIFVYLNKYVHFNIVHNRVFRGIFLLLTPVLTLVIYWFSKNYPKYYQFDKLFSGRISYGYESLELFGIHKIGKKIFFNTSTNVIGQKYFYVDSAFLQYLLRFGLISLIIFLVYTIMFQYRVLKTENTI